MSKVEELIAESKLNELLKKKDDEKVISPIIQAKENLAKALGISPDLIEIIIRA